MVPAPITTMQRARLAELVLKYRLPAMFANNNKENVQAGGSLIAHKRPALQSLTSHCIDPSASFPVEMSMRPKSLCPGRLARGSPQHLGDRALAKLAVPPRCPFPKRLPRDWMPVRVRARHR